MAVRLGSQGLESSGADVHGSSGKAYSRQPRKILRHGRAFGNLLDEEVFAWQAVALA